MTVDSEISPFHVYFWLVVHRVEYLPILAFDQVVTLIYIISYLPATS
jgi:hypothetical protein